MSVLDLKDLKVEHRSFAADLEVRSTPSGTKLSGYASTFTPYQVRDGSGAFTETFRRGAFAETLRAGADVVLLVEHRGSPLARTRSGTLEVGEDNHGLRFAANLDPDDPDVQKLLPKLRRGDLSEMSIAFRATDDEWSRDRSRRTIRAADIDKGDLSIVVHGANSGTSLSLRRRGGSRAASSLVCDARLRVAEARVRAARLMRPGSSYRTAAGTQGEEPDGPRYTQAEIDALGEKGMALKRKNGPGYHCPIVDRRDLMNAIKAWGRAKPSERSEVKAWIKLRAIHLRLQDLLPAAWAPAKPKALPMHGET